MPQGTPNGNNPADIRERIKAEMKAKGVSPELVAEMDRMIPQSAVTQMRQRDREEIRSIEERFNSLEQRIGGYNPHGGGQPQQSSDPFDEWLGTRFAGDNEEAQKGRQFFGEMGSTLKNAVRAEFEKLMNERIQPLAQYAQQSEIDKHLSAQEQRLVSEYGDGVREYLPDVRNRFTQFLRQGHLTDFGAILRDNYPEESKRLYEANNFGQRQEQHQQQHSGGDYDPDAHIPSGARAASDDGGGDDISEFLGGFPSRAEMQEMLATAEERAKATLGVAT